MQQAKSSDSTRFTFAGWVVPMIRIKLLVIISLLLSVSCAGEPDRVTTTASAEIRKLDALAERNDYIALIQQLRSQQAADNELLGWLRSKADNGHPMLQLELSRLLVNREPSEALEWFTIGRIGATLDVLVCEDKTAQAGIPALAMIYQSAFDVIEGDQDKYIPYLERALEWHKRHPVRVDPAWICSHGIGPGGLLGRTQWETAKVQTLRDMQASVEKAKALRENEKTGQTDGQLVSEFQRLYERDYAVTSLVWSADGKYLATTGTSTKSVNIWDVAKKKIVQTFQSDAPGSTFGALTYSPDGRLLAACQQSVKTRTRVWDVSTGAIVRDISSERDMCQTLSFSPDGNWLVVGYGVLNPKAREEMASVALFDTKGWQIQKSWKTPAFIVERLAFSPDGKSLAVGGWSSTKSFPQGVIELWDVMTGQPQKNATIHANTRVESLAYSADGKFIASGTSTGQLGGRRVLETNEWIQQENTDAIRLWSISTNEATTVLKTDLAHGIKVQTLSYTPDAKYLVAGSTDSLIRIWDATTHQLIQVVKASGPLYSLAVSPDSTMLAASSGKLVTVWKMSR